VPLSTSSSSERIPSGPWLKTWIAALLFSTAFFGGAELFWRARGFEPSVKDNPDLWSIVRSKINNANPEPLVLIGSSRTQLGLNPDVLSTALDQTHVLQLAIDGSSPVPVLRDLACDPVFRGTVICEVAPTIFFDPSEESMTKPAQWVANHHRRSRIAALEVPLRVLVEETFVSAHIMLSPRQLLEAAARGELPRAYYVRMRGDRFKEADFARADTHKALEKWERRFSEMGREPTSDELEARFAEVDSLVRRIQGRGGDVVFLQMVSSGRVRDIEARRFPRERYWDPFVRSTSGTAIHFEDVPSLAFYTCGDGSHLDGDSAAQFSLALANELARRGNIVGLPRVPADHASIAR